MRKSFKKGIAILTAAALALGTPIAAGNLPIVSGPQTAIAATGENNGSVVQDVTASVKDLNDKIPLGGWWANFSDYYRFKGDFKVSFNMTLDEREKKEAFYTCPSIAFTPDIVEWDILSI